MGQRLPIRTRCAAICTPVAVHVANPSPHPAAYRAERGLCTLISSDLSSETPGRPRIRAFGTPNGTPLCPRAAPKYGSPACASGAGQLATCGCLPCPAGSTQLMNTPCRKRRPPTGTSRRLRCSTTAQHLHLAWYLVLRGLQPAAAITCSLNPASMIEGRRRAWCGGRDSARRLYSFPEFTAERLAFWFAPGRSCDPGGDLARCGYPTCLHRLVSPVNWLARQVATGIRAPGCQWLAPQARRTAGEARSVSALHGLAIAIPPCGRERDAPAMPAMNCAHR